MGKLETAARAERRRGYLQNAVLASVGIAGVVAVAALAPNTLQLLGVLGLGKTRFNEQARSAANRLARKGHIVFVDINGKKFLKITDTGKRVLELEAQKSVLRGGPKKPKYWDRRWRMIVFDIPERRRTTRNKLRAMVKSFGFLRMQDSVWIYPYDCEEIIVLLKADLHMGREVLYAIVEKIENDTWIRKHFRLLR